MVWKGLLHDSMELVRSGKVKPVTSVQTFDVRDIVEAFSYFSTPSRIGKVTVSFENESSPIKVVPTNYTSIFDASKSYIMVGCLGGLGRSISKWMVARGARYFVFLGRSGLDKSAASALVRDLRDSGATVEVLRGDVCRYKDTQIAVGRALELEPIGGVVQAAMGLKERLFLDMSADDLHTALDPKVKGSWNLHNAIAACEATLDFIMTSSVSGTVGEATMTNYIAANAFLDAFARYRRALGLKARAIGFGMISEVGYLHEHPDIEKLLVGKGIQACHENGMLQIFDLAITGGLDAPLFSSRFSDAHMLTGCETSGLERLRKQGFESINHFLEDPRASILQGALQRSIAAADMPNSAVSKRSIDELVFALAQKLDSYDEPAIVEIVERFLKEKISNLILVPVDDLKPESLLASFGFDSMLAAELRGSLYRSMDVDIPLTTLLRSESSIVARCSEIAGILLDTKKRKKKKSGSSGLERCLLLSAHTERKKDRDRERAG